MAGCKAPASKCCLIEVPSAVIPVEVNYLINPVHPDTKALRIGDPIDFGFDQRMWK